MTTLPSKATFTGAAVTEGGFKAALDALVDYLAEQMGTAGGILAHTGPSIFTANAAGTIPVTAKAAAGQTAAILVVANSAGTALSSFDAGGRLFLPSGGGLTVGTSQLVVDGAGRVGIGTVTPSNELHILRSGSTALAFRLSNTPGQCILTLAADASASLDATTSLAFKRAGVTKLQIDATGALDFVASLVKNLLVDAGADGNKIKHKRGTAAPLAADLEVGEIFIDHAGKKIYSKDAGGAVIEISGTSTGGAYLSLTGGTLTGNLTIDKAADPVITLRETGYSASSGLKITDLTEAQAKIEKAVDVAAAAVTDVQLDIDTSHAAVTGKSGAIRLFRNSNLGGTKKIQVFRGDGTASSDAAIEVDAANTRLNLTGKWNATGKFSVAGSYANPLLIAGMRLWQIASGKALRKKVDTDPSSDMDGEALFFPSIVAYEGEFNTGNTPTFNVTVPTGRTVAHVIAIGGGGAGGGARNTGSANSGAGGGAGGYVEAVVHGLVPGTVIPCQVGHGGRGFLNGDGGAGGQTKFDNVNNKVVANGGIGGQMGVNGGAGGAGGTGTVAAGATIIHNRGGFEGAGASAGVGGRGGDLNSIFAFAGAPGDFQGGVADGNESWGYGWGGGGAHSGGGAQYRGGHAAVGLLVISWF